MTSSARHAIPAPNRLIRSEVTILTANWQIWLKTEVPGKIHRGIRIARKFSAVSSAVAPAITP